jgi:hypothetical protein
MTPTAGAKISAVGRAVVEDGPGDETVQGMDAAAHQGQQSEPEDGAKPESTEGLDVGSESDESEEEGP